MKKLLVILIFLSINLSGYCYDINNQLKDTDFQSIEKHSGGFDIKEKTLEIADGKIEFDIIDGFKKIYNKFTYYIKSNFKSLNTIILLSLLSAIAENIKSSFKSGNNTVYFVVFSLITLNCLKFYTECVDTAYSTMENLLLFVNALYPVMLTTIAAGGGVAAASTLHPVLMVCGGFVMIIINSVILPLLSINVALQLSNSFSDEKQVTKLIGFIESIIKWTVGIMMTVFVGVVTVTGAASKSFDSITVRTAKYAIGSFIPMVGGVISETFDLVLCGSGVIKSSLGLAGLINILFLCISPCIKLAAIAVSFNLCAAIAEPVANKKIVDTLAVFGKTAFSLFGIICASGCMFILCTGVLISLKAV